MPRTDHPAYQRLAEDYAQALQAVADAEAAVTRLPELRRNAETILQMLRAVNPEEPAPPWFPAGPSQPRLILPDFPPTGPAAASWSPDYGRPARPAIPPVGGPHRRGERWNRTQIRHIIATLKANPGETYAEAMNGLCVMYGASASAVAAIPFRHGAKKRKRNGGTAHRWQPEEIRRIREAVSARVRETPKPAQKDRVFVDLGRVFGVSAKAIYTQWHLIENRLEDA